MAIAALYGLSGLNSGELPQPLLALYAAYGSNAAAGANFLGSQGDIWDAQKDMLMDTLGAIAAVLLTAAWAFPAP